MNRKLTGLLYGMKADLCCFAGHFLASMFLLLYNVQLLAQGLQLEIDVGKLSLGTLMDSLFPIVKELFLAIFLDKSVEVIAENCLRYLRHFPMPEFLLSLW
jgi:hypothetical protein